MTQVPLPGEQSALRGYRWQYDHVARLVYDAIVDGEFCPASRFLAGRL